MNITEDPQYKLFFRTHYKVKVDQSFRPTWSGKRMRFPVKYNYYKKPMSLLDKLRYYYKDLMIWLEK